MREEAGEESRTQQRDTEERASGEKKTRRKENRTLVPVLHPFFLQLPVRPAPVGEQVNLLRLALHGQVVRVLALEAFSALPGPEKLADDRLWVDARLEFWLLDGDRKEAREFPGLLFFELLLLLAQLFCGRACFGSRLGGFLELLDVAAEVFFLERARGRGREGRG